MTMLPSLIIYLYFFSPYHFGAHIVVPYMPYSSKISVHEKY